MVVFIWQLDLQLHVQSVPITTKVVSSNPVLDTTLCYKICQQLARGRCFLQVLRKPIKLISTTMSIAEILLKVLLKT